MEKLKTFSNSDEVPVNEQVFARTVEPCPPDQFVTQLSLPLRKSRKSSEPAEPDDIRESMRILPEFMQGFLTELTGKPYKGQKPSNRSNYSYLFLAGLLVVVGLSLAYYGMVYSFGILSIGQIVLGWLLFVCGVRTNTTTNSHFCVHEDFFGKKPENKKWHYLLGEIISIVFMTQNFADYRKEHLDHHNPRVTATKVDPDMEFLQALGFQAGMPYNVLLRHFWFTLFNPKFHLMFLAARLSSNLVLKNQANYKDFPEGIWIHRSLSILSICIQCVLFFKLSWLGFLVAWVIPNYSLYHNAALCQFLSEHFWLKHTDNFGTVKHLSIREAEKRGRVLTAGRFCGCLVPNVSGKMLLHRIWLWFVWTIKMCLHLAARLFTLNGDLPCHDFHHRSKTGEDWANSPYTRQAAVDNLKDCDEPYIEVWGLHMSISTVLRHLSEQPPVEVPVKLDLDKFLEM